MVLPHGYGYCELARYLGSPHEGVLSRLENDPLANPTIDTLCRYAEAVGKAIVITLVDTSKENG